MNEIGFRVNDGILEKYSGDDKYIEIPVYVKEIGESAFKGCEHIESVKIPQKRF